MQRVDILSATSLTCLEVIGIHCAFNRRMKFILAFLLGAHGIAHIVGFVASWRLATLPEAPYKTTLLAHSIDVGDAGVRLVGVLWLAAAVAFVVVGWAVAADANWALRATTVTALASLALCLVGWPEARVGLFVNAGLLLLLVIASRVSLGLFAAAHP